jgi:hypothetical protein
MIDYFSIGSLDSTFKRDIHDCEVLFRNPDSGKDLLKAERLFNDCVEARNHLGGFEENYEGQKDDIYLDFNFHLEEATEIRNRSLNNNLDVLLNDFEELNLYFDLNAEKPTVTIKINEESRTYIKIEFDNIDDHRIKEVAEIAAAKFDKDQTVTIDGVKYDFERFAEMLSKRPDLDEMFKENSISDKLISNIVHSIDDRTFEKNSEPDYGGPDRF